MFSPLNCEVADDGDIPPHLVPQLIDITELSLVAEAFAKLGRNDDALDHLEQILEVLDPGNAKAAERMKALEGKGK